MISDTEYYQKLLSNEIIKIFFSQEFELWREIVSITFRETATKNNSENKKKNKPKHFEKEFLRKKDYNFFANNKKVLDTLDNIAKTLRYTNWGKFIESKKLVEVKKIRGKFNNINSESREVENVINEARNAEFYAMKQLPFLNYGNLEKYYSDVDDMELFLIKENLEIKSLLGFKLDIPASNYIIEVKKVNFIYQNVAVAKVIERSQLVWRDHKSLIITETTNHVSDKYYYLWLSDQKWKLFCDFFNSFQEDLQAIKNWGITHPNNLGAW